MHNVKTRSFFSVMMTVGSLLEAEAAPLAGGRCELMTSIELDVLNGMTETELIHTCAAGSVTVYLNNRESIDQLLSIRLMCFHRDLEAIGVERLVIECILGEGEVSDLVHSHSQKGRGWQLGS